eukprot:s7428_g1.t2
MECSTQELLQHVCCRSSEELAWTFQCSGQGAQATVPSRSNLKQAAGRRHNAWGASERPSDKPVDRSEARRRSSGQSSSQSASKSSIEAKPNQDMWAVKSTDGTMLETEGMWWEWQWWGPSGWSFFSSWVTEQIEKAFALGRASCSLLYDGRQVEFNLASGREVNGEGRIRRIRMPCDESFHGASVCSTFLASTLSEPHGPSLWTNGMAGESKLLSVQEDPGLLSPSRTQSIVVEPSISAGFSSDWFADAPSRNHKPGRHGSRVKHRGLSQEFAVPAAVSVKDIISQPVVASRTEPDHHVWRCEAYEALNRPRKEPASCRSNARPCSQVDAAVARLRASSTVAGLGKEELCSLRALLCRCSSWKLEAVAALFSEPGMLQESFYSRK